MAWSKQERVKSLKLAIQSAKLLGHTAVPQIYPNMFCFMVCDRHVLCSAPMFHCVACVADQRVGNVRPACV